MEKTALDKLQEKLDRLRIHIPKVLAAGSNGSTDGPNSDYLSFIQSALHELLRSRRVLSSSYAYGYFLKDCGYNKTIFEYLQVSSGLKVFREENRIFFQFLNEFLPYFNF